jgi:6,7-dimethyl-8-ribityllumazine synthase
MDQLINSLPAKKQDNEAEVRGWRIAFIQSGWHSEIVDQGRLAFRTEIEKLSASTVRIDFHEVPGAFEIPLRAKILARSRQYAAVVACGLVVDGGIYQHEFVASAVINALMAIQLETEVPVISAILTPQHFHDHREHRTFFTQHFAVKGREAAAACFNTLVEHAKILCLVRQTNS